MEADLDLKAESGDAIDQERVEKQFILKDKNHKSQFREILDTVPQEYIMVAEDVIDFAVQVFDMTLNETIHISLVDHIYHAVENFQQGLVVPTPFYMISYGFIRMNIKWGKRCWI